MNYNFIWGKNRNRGGGHSSGVERELPELQVAGSNPVARSEDAEVAEFGRRAGLRIQWGSIPCGFKSRPRHQNHPSQSQKILLTAILILGIVKSLSCTTYDIPDDPQKLYEEAMKKTEGGIFTRDYEGAEKLLLRIIEIFPASKYVPDAYFGIAYVKMKKGDHAEACILFEKFFMQYNSHPKAPEALYLAIQCNIKFVDTPDRDITYAEKTLQLSKEFLKNYPTHQRADEIYQIKDKMLTVIAEHHYLIAEFYLRRKALSPASERLNIILNDKDLVKTKIAQKAEALKIKIENSLPKY